VTAWRLTGDEKWKAGAVQAASSLSKRYNPAGKFIRAWGALSDPNNAGRVIMDTMMNLDLLAFASEKAKSAAPGRRGSAEPASRAASSG